MISEEKGMDVLKIIVAAWLALAGSAANAEKFVDAITGANDMPGEVAGGAAVRKIAPEDLRFAFDPAKVVIPGKFRDHPLFTRHHMGMNFGFMAKRGWYAAHLGEPRKMAETGVTLCVLKAHFCVETAFSRRFFFDPEYSQGFDELAAMVKALHKEGIIVLLQPCITCLDSVGMYQISFPEPNNQIEGVSIDYWKEWFEGYRGILKAYGEFCEREGVEGIIIGAELNKTVVRADDWRETIAWTRKFYSGPLSYENGGCDFYPWMKDLDFLSVSWYSHGAELTHGESPDPKVWAADPAVSKDEMVEHLVKFWSKPFYELYEKSGHMPILHTENGCTSIHGRCRRPAGGFQRWLKTDALDFEEQANYMQAVFEAYTARMPFYVGTCWWKWEETQDRWFRNLDDPMKDGGFTIWGKPAARTYRRLSDLRSRK